MRKLLCLLAVAMASSSLATAQRAFPSHTPASPPVKPAATEVARVNGVSLTTARLDAALNAIIPMEMFHRSIDAAKMQELRKQALDRIVNEELQYQAGVRLGIKIPDAQVDKEVVGVQRKYGTRAALVAALQKSGASLAELRRELRRTLVIKEAHRRAVTAKCEVTRAGAQRAYNEEPDRFIEPEQLHVYAITIGVEPSANAQQWADAKQRAEEVHKRLKAGESFQAMAREYSTDPSRESGGDMGFLHRGSLNDDFEKVAKDLPLNQPSDVVPSIYGYHLLEVTEIKPPQQKTFADVGKSLQRDLTDRQCASMEEAWLRDLRAKGSVVVSGEGT